MSPEKEGENKPFVVIDGYNLSLEKGTGIATYARNLSYCLKSLGYEVGVLYGAKAPPKLDPLLKEITFFDPIISKPPSWLRRRIRHTREGVTAALGSKAVQIPITGNVVYDTYVSRLPAFDSIWNATDLFNRARRVFRWWGQLHRVQMHRKPALMHWTYPLPIRVSGARNIYTLHDLVPLRLPYTTLDNKHKYLKLIKLLVQRADHIVTVSETSRRDIMSLLGVPDHRVTNTYQAVSIPERLRSKPDDVVKREVEGTFGLKFRGYFLFYGAIEPKKNVGRLIEGYLGSNVGTPLVIVGAPAWKSEQELKLLDADHIRPTTPANPEATAQRRVIRLDYVPFPLLVSLIRGAKATLFPSLYEGFGLPVIESMLLGTPVLSSNAGSIPEVAGEAALLIDPYDTNAISEAIRALDSNAELRDTLAEKGRKQAGLFSEEAYKKKIHVLYRDLAGPLNESSVT
jgi:glycosyltransferase involved in cell wall biosynthesis